MRDGRCWLVIEFDDGACFESTDSFADLVEAQVALDGWCRTFGCEQQRAQ